ncbi:MAG: tetraacyldisaccharide 4'-kinase [Campylobacterales bacterium]
MTQTIRGWGEHYFFGPQTRVQKLLSLLLAPLGWVWCLLARLRRMTAHRERFNIPVIGVGNLVMGGSGKTPMAIFLAKLSERPAVVLRGYGRQSRGMVVVSRWGAIESDVVMAGDEAMEIALALPHALVIVSEDRPQAIREAERLGARVVILDDGFGQVGIEKCEILMEGEASPPNHRCIPAGPWRESPDTRAYADVILQEGRDFWRIVTLPEDLSGMLFVSAISKPERLERWLPSTLARRYFPDHYTFCREELIKAMQQVGATRLLVTGKDAVKVASLGLPYETIKLTLKVRDEIIPKLKAAIQGNDATITIV